VYSRLIVETCWLAYHVRFLGDHWQNRSPYAVGLLSVLSAMSYCDQTVGGIKVKLGMELGIGPGHIVLDGEPVLPWRGTAANFRSISIAASPQFSAHICCGQTAGWTRCAGLVSTCGLGRGPGHTLKLECVNFQRDGRTILCSFCLVIGIFEVLITVSVNN